MKTVKVKIAVVVGPDGRWCSSGFSDETDQELMETAADALCVDGVQLYWLTATLAIPETVTVEADVEST